MIEWLRAKWAHIQDAVAIWDGNLMCPGFCWLKVKASICIALNRESFYGFDEHGDMAPIWASSPSTYWSYDGPGQRWHEVAVSVTKWQFSRYENGF